jgi:hypothetical protein
MDVRDGSELKKVIKKSSDYAEEHNLPSFQDLIQILTTGRVPARKGVSWAQAAKATIVFDNPCLPDINNRLNVHHNLRTHKGWLDFWNSLPEKETDRLKSNLRDMKTYFETCGITSPEGLSFDTKFRPLSFFHEGGEILPVGEFLTRSAEMAPDNAWHGRAMWGDHPTPPQVHGEYTKTLANASAAQRMKTAQVAAFIDFFGKIAPDEIQEAGKADVATRSNRYLERARNYLDSQKNRPPAFMTAGGGR